MKTKITKLPLAVSMKFGEALPANCIAANAVPRGFPSSRFGNGYAGFDADSDDDLKRAGGYVTYSRRKKLMLMSDTGTTTTPSFWVPMVVFLPDDETMLPEIALSMCPFDHGKAPIYVDNDLSPEELRKQIFVDVSVIYRFFEAYYQATGERHEVIYERERMRCLSTGEQIKLDPFPVIRH